ncbi:disease resistance protein Roq1-like isoform X2 [Lotus japonicus]|uniref:disease resistance protein Roq1-like isoform X2 n=1 Tax=Lotus japonicus TaxID=34305 RepID=UPI00258F6B57|nr:disease resistance protein Roq1-like isoform X2 [Lotus japonicus]
MALLPSSSSSTFNYDVLLSCGTEDTQGFTVGIYRALCDEKVHTFFDYKVVDEMVPEVDEAIQCSRVAIIVLSKNYASSSICLDKLSKILDFFNANGRLSLVLPVFYHVDPNDEAMAVHHKSFQDDMVTSQLQKWTMVMQQVVDLPSLHFRLGEDHYHDFIWEIVKEVFNKIINDVPSRVQDSLVGMESRVPKVIRLLDLQSGVGVHMVGITGIGGIGKTALAREVLNLIADQFEVACFLRNVKKELNKHGLSHCPNERFLYHIPGEDEEGVQITYFSDAIEEIRRKLCRKKVLLIVDDVDKLEQLEALAESPNWFCPGSRIITTTRNKHLLVSHGIERIYEVSELNCKEALDLLTWSVFKNNIAPSEYKEALNYAVTLALGLPLSLIVIGSYLCELSVLEWKHYLRSWKEFPDETVQAALEVSFDALKVMEKCVFLDIACCFKGYPLVEVQYILRAHYRHCMAGYIRALVSKSLINISSSGELTLHELMRNMGRQIVRRQSPWQRSRLWIFEDIREILQGCMGTNKIKIICLDFSPTEEGTISWDGEGFKNMGNLKILIIKNVHFSEAPKYLPSSLRVLDWQSYPSQYLPPNFYPGNLSICKLPKCCFVSSEICGLLNKPVNLDDLSFDNGEHSSNEMVYVSCLPKSKEITVMVSE